MFLIWRLLAQVGLLNKYWDWPQKSYQVKDFSVPGQTGHTWIHLVLSGTMASIHSRVSMTHLLYLETGLQIRSTTAEKIRAAHDREFFHSFKFCLQDFSYSWLGISRRRPDCSKYTGIEIRILTTQRIFRPGKDAALSDPSWPLRSSFTSWIQYGM